MCFSRVVQVCFLEALRMFHGNFKEFQGCFKIVLLTLQGCSNALWSNLEVR